MGPADLAPRRACPACRRALADAEASCDGCGRRYPTVAGLPDFRLESDRYLDLDAERAKAERLAAIAEGTDLEGVARAYYAITPDVDPPRCARYLAHILGAEARGAALAASLRDDGPILEVGCGTGGLLVAASRRGLAIEGVDIAARWLVVARRRLADAGLAVPLTAANAERLPWPDAAFATVVADSVIEHCDDPRAALREWRRVLRPGGRLLLWSPNRWAPVIDPHVRLWGLGFLPRRWAEVYVRLRRGGAWIPRTLTAGGAARLARAEGFSEVVVGPAPIPRDWASTRPPRQRRAMMACEALRRFGPTRGGLRAFGPLWSLEARVPEGPPCGWGRAPASPRRDGRGAHAGGSLALDPSRTGHDASGRSWARNVEIRPVGRSGLAACLGAEMVAGGLGFAATVHLARRIGPGGFATLEVALATSGWLLVLVRGGLDGVVVREAARRPRLIGRLTGLLIALRLAWAAVGLGLLGLAAVAGGGGMAVAMASGLVLVTSALVADVGPRARNELTFLAGLSVIRAASLAGFAMRAVSGPGDLVAAAMGLGVGEGCVALACAVRAACGGGWPRIGPGWRAARVFSARAAIAGLTRFGRVGLYAADAVALGLAAGWAGSGAYAAGRRVVFALVAVGVIVPTLLAPALARARARGLAEASIEVGRGVGLLLGLFVPAALGLILTSGRVLPALFGEGYAGGAVLLALAATRLPVLLVASWFGSALVAIGRERAALAATVAAGLVAVAALPIAAVAAGPIGIGIGVLVVEVVAGVGGWISLRRAGVDVGRFEVGPLLAGCLGLAAAVALTSAAPLALTCAAGALGYAAGWTLARWTSTRAGRPAAVSRPNRGPLFEGAHAR